MRCLLLLILATPLLAQTPSQPTTDGKPPVFQTNDGGANGVMQSIFVPPIASAPFTLTLSTDWSRPLANGGTVTLSNQRHIARDGHGRIYQERWVLVPKGGPIRSTLNLVQIGDPDKHTLYNCFVATKTCELIAYNRPSAASYEPHIGVSGPLPNNYGSREVENLGVADTAGVPTTGTRTTLTINPGQLGNDRPMVTTREFWYSTHLGLNLLSDVDDPQNGHQTFRASDVTTSEPDPRLFDLPAGYRIVDLRKVQPPSN